MATFRPKLRILPPAQRALWPRLREIPSRFVLYGGTGLALRLGHRESEDFDFFSSDPLTVDGLASEIGWLSEAAIDQAGRNMAVFAHEGVMLSFFGGLSFGRVGEPQRAGQEGPYVASLLDLAATKLKVLAQRAQAKDYRDVSALLRAGVPLEEGLGAAVTVYGRAFNPLPTVKALGYFGDGDLPTLPRRVQNQLARVAAGLGELKVVRLSSSRLAGGGPQK
jgi:hypothetical protein